MSTSLTPTRAFFNLNYLFNHFSKIRLMKQSVRTSLCSYLLLCVILLTGITATAQTTHSKEKTNGSAISAPAAEGTYQLIFNSKDEDKDITLNAHELQAIEKLRQDNEVVYAMTPYSDDIRIKILPRNAVSGKGFTAASKKYYKTEHPYEEWANIRYVELN